MRRSMQGWVAVVGVLLCTAGGAQAAKGRTAMHVSGVLNLNQASPAQLDLLPGVGEKAAKKIVDYRVKTPFKRVEELVKVKGFGKKKFDKLRPYLAVNGATTLVVKRESAPAAQGRPPPPR